MKRFAILIACAALFATATTGRAEGPPTNKTANIEKFTPTDHLQIVTVEAVQFSECCVPGTVATVINAAPGISEKEITATTNEKNLQGIPRTVYWRQPALKPDNNLRRKPAIENGNTAEPEERQPEVSHATQAKADVDRT